MTVTNVKQIILTKNIDAPREFSVIVAATSNFGIGKDGGLPWCLPSDMAYFKKVTMKTNDTNKQNAVIMGRTTFESIPQKFSPLALRLNIVLSHQPESVLRKGSRAIPNDVIICSCLNDAIQYCEHDANIENVFVIGGAQVYTEALASKACSCVYLTLVDTEIACDTFVPELGCLTMTGFSHYDSYTCKMPCENNADKIKEPVDKK